MGGYVSNFSCQLLKISFAVFCTKWKPRLLLSQGVEEHLDLVIALGHVYRWNDFFGLHMLQAIKKFGEA